MSNTNEQFQSYVFAAANELDQIDLYHQIHKKDFSKIIEQILDEYGLANRLQETNLNKSQTLILDVGCAEGRYLHTIAEILEEKNLLNAASLIGIDLNAASIANAERLAKEAQPPRPYLQFYLHDATQPLENCLSLKAQNKIKFDLIYALRFASFIPNARPAVMELYKALKPGGVIYLYDVVAKPGDEGWLPPPPMTQLVQAMFANFASLNGGVNVSAEEASWLKESGAEMIQTGVKHHITGDGSQEAKQFLRFWVLTFHIAGPMLVKKGFLSQAQFENVMSKTYQELNPGSRGQLSFLYTLARKPL
jgi:SAM-dependent methyltransferase